MIDSKFMVRALRNTPENLRALTAIGERKASNEYHILANRSRLALITHYEWETCDFCNADTGEDGVIMMDEKLP